MEFGLKIDAERAARRLAQALHRDVIILERYSLGVKSYHVRVNTSRRPLGQVCFFHADTDLTTS